VSGNFGGAVVEEQRREVPSASFGNAPIFTGYAGTLLILGGAAALLYHRFDEWWPFYRLPHPDPNVRVLTLSEMGDVLAGISAPLAFLWLFVATWLQRQELALQRKELVSTRVELQRAADESHKQTDLMNQTLQASKSREIYEEFSLELYYLARQTQSLLSGTAYFVRYNNIVKSYDFVKIYGKDISLESTGSVDFFFEYLFFQMELLSKTSFAQVELDDHHLNILSRIKSTSDAFNDFIVKHTRTENKITQSRIKALRLPELFAQIEWTRQELSETLMPPGPS
jgi:hypothetical protein